MFSPSLCDARNEGVYNAKRDLFSMMNDDADDVLNQVVHEQVNELSKMELQLNLEINQLHPDPESPILVANANAATQHLMAKPDDVPRFKDAQAEYNFHAEYRNAVDAHTELYARIKNNQDTGRENTQAMLDTAEKLQQAISGYEIKHMGKEQFNTTLEEKRMNGATLASRKYDPEQIYSKQKAREEQIANGNLFKVENQVAAMNEVRAEAAEQPQKLPIEDGKVFGLPVTELLNPENHLGYTGVQPSGHKQGAHQNALQDLNTLIVLLTLINQKPNVVKDLFLMILNRELSQSLSGKSIVQPSSLPGIDAFVDQVAKRLTQLNKNALTESIHTRVEPRSKSRLEN